MIAVIVAVALATAAVAAAVVILVSVGARLEPQQDLLPVQAPGPLTGLARHVLGLHVRRPRGHAAIATADTWQESAAVR